MAVSLTYGAINLNDGATYTLLDGFDPGEKLKTFAEYRSYSGSVAQANVTESNLIEVVVPVLVQAASLTLLRDAVDAINTTIDGGAVDLVYDDGYVETTYTVVESPRVSFRVDAPAVNRYWTVLELVLYRTPDYVDASPPVPLSGGASI